MPKKVALEWDASQLRIVVGRTGPDGCSVTDCRVIDLQDDSGDIAPSISEVLKKTAVEMRLGKIPALVSLGRGSTEMRPLKLPPVPADEVPDMVRFAAAKAFATSGDAVRIDYLPGSASGDAESDGLRVLAAALPGPRRSEIIETIENAGLTIGRIAMRPTAAAALYQSDAAAGDAVLLDLMDQDADMVVVSNGCPVYVRSFRLPKVSESAGDDSAAQPAENAETSEETPRSQGDEGVYTQQQRDKVLVGELKRSLLAARSAIGDMPPSRLVIWGEEEVHADQARVIADATDLDVSVLSPLSLVDVAASDKTLPVHSGRMAPLIGLLNSDETDASQLIDFENPRRPPPPKSNRQRLLIYGAVAAAVLLVVGYGVYSQFTGLNAQIQEKTAALDAQKDDLEKADALIAKQELIDSFLDGQINWLGELEHISQRIPPSDQAIVERFSGTTLPRTGGGRISLVGSVTDAKLVSQMTNDLADDSHEVVNGGSNQTRRRNTYGQTFDATITIPSNAIRNARAIAEANAQRDAASQQPTTDSPADDAVAETADDPVIDPTEESEAGEDPSGSVPESGENSNEPSSPKSDTGGESRPESKTQPAEDGADQPSSEDDPTIDIETSNPEIKENTESESAKSEVQDT